MAKAVRNTGSARPEPEHHQAAFPDVTRSDSKQESRDWYQQALEQLEAEHQKLIDELRNRHEGEIRRIKSESDRLVRQAQSQATEEIELIQASSKFNIREYENKIEGLKQKLEESQREAVDKGGGSPVAEDYSDIKKRITDQEESLRKTVGELTRYKQLSADLERALKQSKEHLDLSQQEIRDLVRRAKEAQEQAERYSRELKYVELQTQSTLEQFKEDSQKKIEELTGQLKQSEDTLAQASDKTVEMERMNERLRQIEGEQTEQIAGLNQQLQQQERTHQQQMSQIKKDYELEILNLQSQYQQKIRDSEDKFAAQVFDLQRTATDIKQSYTGQLGAITDILEKSASQQAEAAKVQLDESRRFYQRCITELKELLEGQKNAYNRRIEQLGVFFKQQIDASADNLHKELDAFKDHWQEEFNKLREQLGKAEGGIAAVEMGVCDCCGKTDIPACRLEKISSGHRFCPDCLAELRA